MPREEPHYAFRTQYHLSQHTHSPHHAPASAIYSFHRLQRLSIFDQPLLYISRFSTEIHTNLKKFS